jgi:hypothetical protein
MTRGQVGSFLLFFFLGQQKKKIKKRRRRRETWRSARPGLVSPLATARCFSNLEGKKKQNQRGEKEIIRFR